MYRLVLSNPNYYRTDGQLILFNFYFNEILIGESVLFIHDDTLYIQSFRINTQYQRIGNGRRFYQSLENHILTHLPYQAIRLISTKEGYIFWSKMGYSYERNWKNDMIEMYKFIKKI